MSGQVFSKLAQAYNDNQTLLETKDGDYMAVSFDGNKGENLYMAEFAKYYGEIYKKRLNSKTRMSKDDKHFTYIAMGVWDRDTKTPLFIWLFKYEKNNEKIKKRIGMNDLKIRNYIHNISKSLGYGKRSKKARNATRKAFSGMKQNYDYQYRSSANLVYQIIKFDTTEYNCAFSDYGVTVEPLKWDEYEFVSKKMWSRGGVQMNMVDTIIKDRLSPSKRLKN